MAGIARSLEFVSGRWDKARRLGPGALSARRRDSHGRRSARVCRDECTCAPKSGSRWPRRSSRPGAAEDLQQNLRLAVSAWLARQLSYLPDAGAIETVHGDAEQLELHLRGKVLAVARVSVVQPKDLLVVAAEPIQIP